MFFIFWHITLWQQRAMGLAKLYTTTEHDVFNPFQPSVLLKGHYETV